MAGPRLPFMARLSALGPTARTLTDDDTGAESMFLDGKIDGIDSSIDDQSRAYLIRAVCMLAKATGRIPALADANFDLPQNA